ncbi:deoxyribodipyrimidine photo-lyase [Fulvivirgaceae bacterium BMA12]|uniref:Deoxyribodipyrimidine photo-lyase n=1 Tax=Agaribacillus aureus TaxID=3051825 RepID=A0ABT8LA06_9BACT|nr:deoxyribodipyrimidine photo-lyase [Fulvivirgaceae bacterium BMA12]
MAKLIAQEISVFWFRRDLRFHDNTALTFALNGPYPVLPIFILDRNILDGLENRADPRVTFIHREIQNLNLQLQEVGSGLQVYDGRPVKVWQEMIKNYNVKAIYANRDYEPYARKRDREVYELLAAQGIPFISKKDHVIFEKSEVIKDDGTPYKVYTPYSKKWKSLLRQRPTTSYPSALSSGNWVQVPHKAVMPLKDIGFSPSEIELPSREVPEKIIKSYHENRDFPAIKGTSRLSLHLRFGTISIRQLVTTAGRLSEKYLNELIWRDFYQMILWHFPQVERENFNRKYDGIEWRNNTEEFAKWCAGETGYPIVDAGMRELNSTGFMHNRVRMITASFLTKHLLIDWRWGEAYFAEKLLDYELASNNGGWQWAAGTGVDAAPYFRIFNPDSQTKKFDQKHQYIKKWVPEYQEFAYPAPMVDHKFARERVLKTYRKALENGS